MRAVAHHNDQRVYFLPLVAVSRVGSRISVMVVKSNNTTKKIKPVKKTQLFRKPRNSNNEPKKILRR